MSAVLDKDVLSQGFGEQVSNLNISANEENFNFSMMDMFMKMVIAYIDLLCARAELGSLPSSKAPALSSNTLQDT